MKLSAKMALCMLLVLGILFALCGYALTGASFQSALDDAARQSTALHAQQKLLLLRELCMTRDASKNGTLQDYDFTSAAQQVALRESPDMACAIITKGYAALYSTLPAAFGKAQQAGMVATKGNYRLVRMDESTYFTMASTLSLPEREVYLLNTFDVTAVFARRTQQTRLFWQIYAGMMLVAAVVCAFVAAWLTRPVARLNRAAKAVAAGAYGERVARPRRHGDEIDELSHSFDAMSQAVQEKVASLELSVRQREDFMGAFTHELKTPMTAMMGYAALLQRDNITQPMREKALCYLHSETKRLEALSQKLLMLLGLADEGVTLARVSVQTLFAAVQAALPEETTRRHTILFHLAPETPDAVGDMDLLVDLLRNLIENAVHASSEGAAVEVSARGVQTAQDGVAAGEAVRHRERQQNGALAQDNAFCTPPALLRFSVCDSGCGIPEAELTRVTEAFYSVDKSRSRAQGGSGLGLSICERIARLHSASLTLANRPQGGAEASFVLRAALADDAVQSKGNRSDGSVLASANTGVCAPVSVPTTPSVPHAASADTPGSAPSAHTNRGEESTTHA